MMGFNQPYVKEYQNGVLVNPIKGTYSSPYPNRAQRRKRPGRELSNKKGDQIVLVGPYKYKKVLQEVNGRRIVHSLPVGMSVALHRKDKITRKREEKRLLEARNQSK